MRGKELRPFVRRAASPGPAGVILVVGLGRTEHVEAAKRIERLDVHRDGGRNAILREHLADGAVLAFRRGSVVSPDVEDQGVVSIAEAIDFIDEPADMVVRVFGIAGGYLHQPALEWLLILGNAVPGGKRIRSRCELSVRGNPAHLLGALEDPLTVVVPAVVELALILVSPSLHDVVGAVNGAARPVHEEWLVRFEGFVLAQPA